jgi:hypothetical protein
VVREVLQRFPSGFDIENDFPPVLVGKTANVALKAIDCIP